MRYYSDVKICLYKKNFKELKAKLERIYEGKCLLDNIIYSHYNYEDVIVFGWECIKWYSENFMEIKIIEDFLEELYEKGIAYSYIKVGEGYNDIEIQKYYGDKNNDFSCDKIYLEECIQEKG